MNNSFQQYDLQTACLTANCDLRFPSALHAWRDERFSLDADGTHFGFVQTGAARLKCAAGEFLLSEKMYFCVPDACEIAGGSGIVVTRIGARGIFSIGGALEHSGRLKYINGCTDTLLIAPLVRGEACLNALFFPPGIVQTPHTHPSARIGIVAQGAGECVTPNGIFALRAGSAFVIAPETLHSFNTSENSMTVVAYHPDSDFGATDENHPMINKTIVAGVSAANIKEIRT